MKLKGIILLIVSLLIIGIGVFFSLKNSDQKCIIEFYSFENIEKKEIQKGKYIQKPNDPVREGYIFNGWYNNGELFDFSNPIMHNIKLEAEWEEKLTDDVYIVSFDSDGGTKVESQNINGNGKVVKPADPIKDGYTFIEWQLENSVYDFTDKVTKGITLKAIWKISEKITITFDTDGGNIIENQIISENTIPVKPKDPIKSGYTFVMWNLDDNEYTFNEKINKDTILKAVWEKSSMKTITFDSNGGNSVKKQIIEKGKLAVKPTNPTKSGYVFVSWQIDGVDYNFATKVTRDLTLIATWKIANNYTVVFDSNGGSLVDSKEVVEGNKVEKPTNPTREGHVFNSWQLNNNSYDFNKIITGDITLTAKWIQKTYTIIWEDIVGKPTEKMAKIYEDGVLIPIQALYSDTDGTQIVSAIINSTSINIDETELLKVKSIKLNGNTIVTISSCTKK